MSSRVDFRTAAPDVVRLLFDAGRYLGKSDLDPQLLELVAMRASQINGCAFCLNWHAGHLRSGGESEQRLYVLDAWREAPLYSERERAALAWTEAVTRLDNGAVPDDVYEEALRHFGEKGLVELTFAVALTNTWNRLNISFPSEMGPLQVRAA